MSGDPDNPEFLHSRATELLDEGRLHRTSGRLDLALQCFRSALSIDPALAPAALALGQTYYDLGKSSESLQYLERALQLEPENAAALCSCGQALADAGHTDLALTFLRKAIEAEPENLKYRLATIDVLQGIEFVAESPWYESFLIDCLDDPQLQDTSVTNVALSLLWVKPAMRDALADEQLTEGHVARLAREPLLARLLSRTVVRSWEFEKFFTRLRRALTQMGDPQWLPLAVGLAEQAFNAGYVQYQSEDEARLEQALAQKDAGALTPRELMTLASYRALVDFPGAAELSRRSDWPEAMQCVIQRTLREPIREQEIRSCIDALTPIRDAVSRRVQAQYEEHPYPRWLNIQATNLGSERLADTIAKHALNFTDPGWPQRPKALVPGCGTGYHPLSLAHRHPELDILAVDLSRTSLAYAIRKQEELQISNVRFCQADLLGLVDSGERYEYIDCAGVLHHMGSPIEGWRVLSTLLRPGGVMRVGLYSELARTTIVAAREKIAALRIPSTPSAIRQFRQSIMNDPELSELRSLASMAGDFFSMGEVRDLIFHEQEHRFDLPTVKQYLEELGLEFGGFLLSDRDTVRKFHSLNPEPAQWLDLDRWAQFEAENPSTFLRMYQFYCLKPRPEDHSAP